ncbi:MAG TPA: TlpA disulfide reductase family protein [Bryobacteraceae bacterium]|jgi:cytochrome c biogenesis protein CcmG/thiol:disulfide interchange protein DsbE|nr:TlpA disulfide reductase family protein [Bryobacteraceae bacterium]
MGNNNAAQVGRWVDERLATLCPAGDWQPDPVTGLARLRERTGGDRAHGRSWTWAAAAATAVAFGFLAFPAPRAAAQRFCTACLMAAQNLATRHTAGIVLKPAKERKPAPDFTLDDASGRPVQLSGFKGKVILLNFWATWCGGCKVEIPWLIEFQEQYGQRGFVVLGVSLDADGWKLVRPFITEKKINYRVMIGTDDIAARYGADQALPVSVLIDQSGRIAATHVGLPEKSAYRAEIEKLLDGKTRTAGAD